MADQSEKNVTLYVKIRIPGDHTPESIRGEVEDLLLDMPGVGVDEVGVASYVLPEHAAEVTTAQAWAYARRERGLLVDVEDPS